MFPKMFKVQQVVPRPTVTDVALEVKEQLQAIRIAEIIRPGMKIAVTAGSRGITNIALIIKTVVEELKALGAEPFIVPAMGSHGGATAEGQKKILANYGITSESMGVPIKATMEVVEIGTTKSGLPVYCDSYAAAADGIVLINRIKPHTAYKGEIESGLCKIMTIGLGKHVGASNAHRYAYVYGLQKIVPEMAEVFLVNLPVLFGVGLVENAYGEIAEVAAIRAENIVAEEKRLLQKAEQLIARIPFPKIDILIVDEIGKEISGTGMDTNVVGRIQTKFFRNELPSAPDITRIYLRDITPGSGGNANGVGLADFISERLFNKIDLRTTYINAITAQVPERARIPIVCKNDEEALQFASQTAGPIELKELKIVHIKNTLHLKEMLVSEALLESCREVENLVVSPKPYALTFDTEGNLIYTAV